MNVDTIATGTSWTPNCAAGNVSQQTNTQTAGTLTINAPTGTPVNGQILELILDGTNVQTLTFNATYRVTATITALPTASTGSGKTDRLLFQYQAADTKWDILSVAMGA